MDEYSRHPPARRHDHAQPNPSAGEGAAPRQPNDPMAFLEFLSCSLCSYPYEGAGSDGRAFWATSCGHILCSDPGHRHQHGVCTYCNRAGVVIHVIDENSPGKLQKWFQPRSQIISGIGDSLGLLKFAELERLARSQSLAIAQLEATVDECHASLRALKVDKDEQAKQAEQNNRQLTDMKRQLNEANAQTHALQERNASLEERNASLEGRTASLEEQLRQHSFQQIGLRGGHDGRHSHSQQHSGQHVGGQHNPPQHPSYQHLAGPSQGPSFERGPPQFSTRSHEYEAPEFEPMGPPPPPLKRPRPDDTTHGLPFAPRQSNAEFPPRPSTTINPPRVVPRQLESSFNRPASAANFASGGFAPAGTAGGVRNNLEQYIHRPELVPSSVALPQPQSRPSFTLARTSHTQQWRGAARHGAAGGADDLGA